MKIVMSGKLKTKKEETKSVCLRRMYKYGFRECHLRPSPGEGKGGERRNVSLRVSTFFNNNFNNSSKQNKDTHTQENCYISRDDDDDTM